MNPPHVPTTPNTDSRVLLRMELDRATEEAIHLSEMIMVLKASRAIDDYKLGELSVERATANLRVSELREELSALVFAHA